MRATDWFDVAVWTKRWATRLALACAAVSAMAYGAGVAYALGALSAV